MSEDLDFKKPGDVVRLIVSVLIVLTPLICAIYAPFDFNRLKNSSAFLDQTILILAIGTYSMITTAVLFAAGSWLVKGKFYQQMKQQENIVAYVDQNSFEVKYKILENKKS